MYIVFLLRGCHKSAKRRLFDDSKRVNNSAKINCVARTTARIETKTRKNKNKHKRRLKEKKKKKKTKKKKKERKKKKKKK